ncbi:hypothetical protein BBL07_10390 [Agrobacterium vitis]|nr:hypothetical protein BBL07_10390 [Agrobacterium vitis]
MIGGRRQNRHDRIAIGFRLIEACVRRSVNAVLEQPHDPDAASPQIHPPAATVVLVMLLTKQRVGVSINR